MKRWMVLPLLLLVAANADARGHGVAAPYPLLLAAEVKGGDLVYPSVAGDFLVYSQRDQHGFAVTRVLAEQPEREGLVLRSSKRHGAIRRGVALADGAIGYVCNRMGPISAWKRWSNSDLHQLVINGGNFIGGLVPIHLAANRTGTVWAVDTYLNRERRSRYLDTFANVNLEPELLGQNWRIYWSDADHWKVGYKATERGTRNKFDHPALFVQRDGVITMIRNAFDATLSADGNTVVFVREQNGNFDLWMQNLASGALTRLTSNRFGDFEPALSPDGKKVAFVSNRDSKGSVRHTMIYVLDLESGAITQVTDSARAVDGGPTWNGNHRILFHSNRDPHQPQRSTEKQWRIWEVQL